MDSLALLANITVVQLVSGFDSQYPLAFGILTSDYYIDDVVTGAQSLEEALKLYNDPIVYLRSGDFEL